jgi:hypothetical protein
MFVLEADAEYGLVRAVASYCVAALCVAKVQQQLLLHTAVELVFCPSGESATVPGVDGGYTAAPVFTLEDFGTIGLQLFRQSLHGREEGADTGHVGVRFITGVETVAIQTDEPASTVECGLLGR